MDNRDININAIDTLHHVQGLSHISKSVEREERRKDRKKKEKDDQSILQQRKIDEKLEEELEAEEKEVLADEDMNHINFRA